METLATAVQTIDLREPIPGYVLGDRLGSGGFGEVWRADAPGGLAKAVKIVYGQLQGDRAGKELKALQKIKEVRHPMLLSLERIESVADHLVIVMELADGSLRDRQAEREAAGLPGIPRDELLAYLRDAADAMDYLVEHHALLHLDIKPENLLLVADRVKVADFGLMRELDESNVSLVSGMTPLYAAPEVFDGKPHRQSDQYSLAIVYQELLTGQPPFAGRTAAQLISQHLHSQPNLKSLPTFDQPVIARALSKVAERRFANCRALVEELAKAPRTAERTQTRRALGDAEQVRSAWQTASATTTFKPDRLAQTDLVSLAFPASTEVRNLSPITLEADLAFARPTLFVGVGGMGTRVLCALKQSLREKFGSVEETPALQFLALETDPQGLSQVSSEGQDGGLRFHESLLLPLQNPQDYRAKSSALLEWMNRRWLYNIPRSHKTEGIRALGRLAFVDHFGPIVDALHSAIAMATAPTSLEMSARRTGLQFAAGPPRVFVVGSTTGGTGGGMLLDLGYTLRTLFKTMDLADDEVCGILTCAMPLRGKARDLAVANTIALLGELKQYSQDRYPGEPACELPAFTGQAPFPSTYFVHHGEAADEAAFQRSATSISDYLVLNSVTPAAAFFARCRNESRATVQQGPVATRTFGLSRIDCQSNNVTSIAAEALSRSLFIQWADHAKAKALSPQVTRGAVQEKAQSLAAKFTDMFGLTKQRVVEDALRLIRQELDQNARQHLRKALNDNWVQSSQLDAEDRVNSAVGTIDRLIGATRELSAAANAKSLTTMLDRQLKVKSQQTKEALQDWLAKLVDTPFLRVAGARFACRWLLRHFEQLERVASEDLNQLNIEIDRLRSSLHGMESEAQADTDEPIFVSVNSTTFKNLLAYSSATLDAAIYRRTIRSWQMLAEATTESERRLSVITHSLEELVSQIPETPIRAALQDSERSSVAQLGSVQQKLPQLVATLDRELDPTRLGQLLLLDEFSSEGGVDLENLARLVSQQAKALVRRHFQKTTPGESRRETYDTERFGECVNRALPSLASNGGAKRALVLLPTDGELNYVTLSKDRRLAEEAVTMLTEGEGEVSVCFELEQVPLDNIAVSLMRNRSDYLDLAARLHTRIDVQWQPFEATATQVDAS